MAELELGALLITRGEGGMTLLRPGAEEMHLPARAREVFDVTGAGDTVIAVLAAAVAAGSGLPEAVGLANVAASIVVGKLGTASVSAPELRRAVQEDQGSERGVVTLEQLQIAMPMRAARAREWFLPMVAFDIIHAGHVAYLEQARQLGDRLIVAVNSDDSVRRLKGKGRPINPAGAAHGGAGRSGGGRLGGVFHRRHPRPLLRALQPEILVKGGDYDKEGVVGWEIVEEYGGEVKVLAFVENVSTTAIVTKIQQDR